jgi:hypothetical protein
MQYVYSYPPYLEVVISIYKLSMWQGVVKRDPVNIVECFNYCDLMAVTRKSVKACRIWSTCRADYEEYTVQDCNTVWFWESPAFWMNLLPSSSGSKSKPSKVTSRSRQQAEWTVCRKFGLAWKGLWAVDGSGPLSVRGLGDAMEAKEAYPSSHLKGVDCIVEWKRKWKEVICI